MSFAFELEPVLSYRKLIEENEEHRLQVIESSIQAALRLNEDLLAQSAAYSKMLASPQGDAGDGARLKNVAAYLGKLHSEIIRTKLVIAKLEEDKRAQLGKFVQAKQAREIVDKLKEKKVAAHGREESALQQKLLDEMAVDQLRRMNGVNEEL